MPQVHLRLIQTSVKFRNENLWESPLSGGLSLEYRVVPQDDGVGVDVTLAGVINEDAELSLTAIRGEIADKGKVTFNFAGIKSINSLGVRAWVQFLRSVEEGREITFLECTPDIIMQINMIPSFSGRAIIGSFYTNYICEACDTTTRALVDLGKLPPKTVPTTPQCEACSAPMETEELEEEYFAFLSR